MRDPRRPRCQRIHTKGRSQPSRSSPQRWLAAVQGWRRAVASPACLLALVALGAWQCFLSYRVQTDTSPLGEMRDRLRGGAWCVVVARAAARSLRRERPNVGSDGARARARSSAPFSRVFSRPPPFGVPERLDSTRLERSTWLVGVSWRSADGGRRRHTRCCGGAPTSSPTRSSCSATRSLRRTKGLSSA